jgi:hypothetical protein
MLVSRPKLQPYLRVEKSCNQEGAHRDVNLQITLAGLIMVFEDGNFVELTSKTNSGAFSPSLPIREPLLKFVEINVVNRGNV